MKKCYSLFFVLALMAFTLLVENEYHSANQFLTEDPPIIIPPIKIPVPKLTFINVTQAEIQNTTYQVM